MGLEGAARCPARPCSPARSAARSFVQAAGCGSWRSAAGSPQEDRLLSVWLELVQISVYTGKSFVERFVLEAGTMSGWLWTCMVSVSAASVCGTDAARAELLPQLH